MVAIFGDGRAPCLGKGWRPHETTRWVSVLLPQFKSHPHTFGVGICGIREGWIGSSRVGPVLLFPEVQ
jgi:hypothetical protein